MEGEIVGIFTVQNEINKEKRLKSYAIPVFISTHSSVCNNRVSDPVFITGVRNLEGGFMVENANLSSIQFPLLKTPYEN